jgi:pimeloyl-ACP methyl ester carboxylesterase
MHLETGDRLGRYEILEPLGAGGMGEVYRARDTELERDVAIKVLPEGVAQNPARLARFEREARAVAQLSHQSILAIHDFGREGDVTYAVTELLEGSTLRQALSLGGRFSVDKALEIASNVAAGLAAAHSKGVIHRDIKPDNIFLTADGGVKVLDFGLARVETPVSEEDETGTLTPAGTLAGTILGTPGYMAPEQVRGRPADARSDVFSFGCVLYEMLSGRRAFRRDTTADTLSAILNDDPPRLRIEEASVPDELRRVLRRCLEKEPGARFPSGVGLQQALGEVANRLSPPPQVSARAMVSVLKRPTVVIPTVIALAVVGVLAVRWFQRESKQTWVRETAIPEVMRLVDEDDFVGAFAVASEVHRYVPSDPVLDELWARMSNTVSIRTDPPGATVSYKEYNDVDGSWTALGQTPLEEVRFPRGVFRWRFEKDGFETRIVVRRVFDPDREAVARKADMFSFEDSSVRMDFKLDPVGSLPKGMVAVEGGLYSEPPLAGLSGVKDLTLGRFLIDRTEVTNRQFREFVDAGGYERPEFWKEEFVREGEAVPFEEAVDSFRDTTGRYGPATWELGDFPDGRGDHPVGGVSWYEAAAYCEFRGKSLPTVYHWARAALASSELLEPLSPFIIPLSNLGGDGPATVASFSGIGISGAHDLAGNVREWCLNAAELGRYNLGGAWSDPVYVFTEVGFQPAWDRLPVNGFRCVSYLEGDPDATLTAPPDAAPPQDFYGAAARPDEVFQTLRELSYSYEPVPLNAAVESPGESPFGGREEWVTVDAAYGQDRLPIRLHLPEDVEPPYQAVVWVSGAGILYVKAVRDHDPIHSKWLNFIVKSGRAVVQPVVDGTYERNDGRTLLRLRSANSWRELYNHWRKDLGRTLDYLEERQDIDSSRVAYAGLSLGAGGLALDILAFEDRFRAALLWSGGFGRGDEEYVIDAVDMAKRITIPVLMINGRYDFALPYDTHLKPMFDLLGTPVEHKRHVLFDAGHWPFPRGQFIRENLDWLDRYLGTVGSAEPPSTP